MPELLVPDRFEGLKLHASEQLKTIISPVEDALAEIDRKYLDMKAAARGSFLIFRGESGSGKSTFLHTVNMFRNDCYTQSIDSNEDVAEFLQKLGPAGAALRIVVVEGREALRDTTTQQIERALHAINAFLRTPNGLRTLVVWPCNADDIQDELVSVGRRVGGDALLGVGDPVYVFSGPPRDKFLEIGSRTVAALNQGASLYDLGVSEQEAMKLAEESPTIGKYLGKLRRALLDNMDLVGGLLAREQCKMWVVVVAGNDPDNDVAALTRGSLHAADIDRLLSATEANVVQELRTYPEKIGILGTVLDAKILHLPVKAALAIARQYGDETLHKEMNARGLSTARDKAARERLFESDLGRAFRGATTGPRTRGPKVGSNTVDAFGKLVAIASGNDRLLNRAIGEALKDAGLIDSYDTEKALGDGLSRCSDIFVECGQGVVRLEVMWRKTTSRAEIANYTLTKLWNYGKAIGYLP